MKVFFTVTVPVLSIGGLLATNANASTTIQQWAETGSNVAGVAAGGSGTFRIKWCTSVNIVWHV
jgi:hypothetical protein